MKSPKKSFNVVIPRDDGGIEIHRMKAWLRRNPDHLPDGFDQTSSNSHQLRNALIKNGWKAQVTQTEERLLMPGVQRQVCAVKPIIGEEGIYHMDLIPVCPEVLPYGMDTLIHKLGSTWASSEACPRITENVKDAWNKLLNDWSADDSLPLLIRKSSLVRGSELRHASSRKIIPTDNSPAQWACGLALRGKVPTITEIHDGFIKDEIPVSFAHKKNEREQRRYHCTLGKYGINKAGWKLCHINPVGQKSQARLETVEIEILKQSFFDLLSPSNYFLVPINWSGLGEVQEFIDGFLGEANSTLNINH